MRRGLLLCAVLLLAAITGCKSNQISDAQLQSERFWRHMTQSTEAANAGDLEAARAALDEAAAIAVTERQERKATSLARLYDGVDALMAGDAAAARQAWSRIEDPALRGEVHEEAAAIGVAVPDTPLDGATASTLNSEDDE